jgi:hypothetical protein
LVEEGLMRCNAGFTFPLVSASSLLGSIVSCLWISQALPVSGLVMCVTKMGLAVPSLSAVLWTHSSIYSTLCPGVLRSWVQSTRDHHKAGWGSDFSDRGVKHLTFSMC